MSAAAASAAAANTPRSPKRGTNVDIELASKNEDNKRMIEQKFGYTKHRLESKSWRQRSFGTIKMIKSSMLFQNLF